MYLCNNNIALGTFLVVISDRRIIQSYGIFSFSISRTISYFYYWNITVNVNRPAVRISLLFKLILNGTQHHLPFYCLKQVTWWKLLKNCYCLREHFQSTISHDLALYKHVCRNWWSSPSDDNRFWSVSHKAFLPFWHLYHPCIFCLDTYKMLLRWSVW